MASKKVYKILILIFNIILAIAGFSLLFFNSVMLYHLIRYKQFIDSASITVVALLIFFGFISCAFATIGWNVMIKEKRVYTIIFGSFLFILMACHIGFCIWSLTIIHNVKDKLTVNIELTFEQVIKDKVDTMISLWDKMQSELSCCGVGGPTDYRSSNHLPFSCCIRNSNTQQSLFGDCHSIHQQGCLLHLYDTIKKYLFLTSLSSLAMSLIQVLGGVLYIYFAKSIVESSNRAEIRRPSNLTTRTTSAATRSLLSSSPPPKY